MVVDTWVDCHCHSWLLALCLFLLLSISTMKRGDYISGSYSRAPFNLYGWLEGQRFLYKFNQDNVVHTLKWHGNEWRLVGAHGSQVSLDKNLYRDKKIILDNWVPCKIGRAHV